MATFQVEAQRGEQDLYRCITLSPRGAAVSNFGELIVRGELDLGNTGKSVSFNDLHTTEKKTKDGQNQNLFLLLCFNF